MYALPLRTPLIQPSKTQRGFSLLDVAIVMGIVGVLMAGFLATYKLYQAQRAIGLTEENMTAVQEALGTYVALNNAYPEPAPYGRTEGHDEYGRAGGSQGSCSNATAAVGRICTGNGVGGANVLTGMVPFADLNLTPDMVRDGFGRMLTYSVGEALTLPDGADPSIDGSGNLTYDHHVCVNLQNIDENGTITNIGCGTAADNPGRAIALISHGKDGIGAWLPSGRQYQACDALAEGSQNENCDFDGTFVQATATVVRQIHERKDPVTGAVITTAEVVDEARRPAIFNGDGTNRNDDIIQIEIREDTNFWSPGADDTIANRYNYHVAIGLSTPPATPLHVGGNILAEDKILAEGLCDATGGTCIETEAIAGTKPEMRCGRLGLAQTVRNNQVECVYPTEVNACPAGQYVAGVGANGERDCRNLPPN